MRASRWDTHARVHAENSGADSLPAGAGAAGSNEDPVLDLATFGAFRDVLDPHTLADIYREFLQTTATRVAALPGLRDREELARLAHTLKGTAGMLGANRVAARAARLEQELELPGEPDLRTTADELGEACAELRVALARQQVAL